MTMLSTIQHFCRRTNLTVPSTVLGTTNEQIAQIMAILEEEGADLSGRGDWQYLTQEATHTTVATESQGAITTIAGSDFRYIKNNTIWDRTENLPLIVLDGVDWQAEKGFATTSPRYHIRLRGNNLVSNPIPPAGNTWAFEWVSWNWILDNDGTTTKQYFTEDTDTFLIPEPILLAGLRWRWKKEKGFDYAEDFNTYEALVRDALGRDGIKSTLFMDGGIKENIPRVFVNQGTWPL